MSPHSPFIRARYLPWYFTTCHRQHQRPACERCLSSLSSYLILQIRLYPCYCRGWKFLFRSRSSRRRVRCDWWEGAGAAPYGKWYGALLPSEDGTERFSLTSSMGIQFILVYDISRGILQPVVASINALLSLLTLMFTWVPLFVTNSIGDQY